ncbi:MAG: hypothetical protein ACE5FG_12090 [Myxococcota bacterium]
MNGPLRSLPACLLVVGLAGSAPAKSLEAESLEVVRGPGPVPEQLADLGRLARVEQGEQALQERGYTELPHLAFAVLDAAVAAPAGQRATLLERARELAPQTPSVRYAMARLAGDSAEIGAALGALRTSLPGLIWLATILGAAVGIAALLAVAVLVLAAFSRGAVLHGHRIGHVYGESPPRAWPGVLLLLGLLACLPALGAGPGLVLAVAGLIGAMRLRALEASQVCFALIVAGLVLGPGVQGWARLVAFPVEQPAVLAAWRTDRAQPLPEDRGRLEEAVERAPANALLRLALATAWAHGGELSRARQVLAGMPSDSPRSLRARAANLRGMLHVALGEVEDGIAAFHESNALEVTPEVLYNLSQASGRILRFSDQSEYFQRARHLAPSKVAQATAGGAPSLHRFLLRPAIPLLAYWSFAVRGGPESVAIEHELHDWALGSRAPDWAWVVLPALGLLALALRFTGVRICARCGGPLCSRCAVAVGSGVACVSCAAYIAAHAASDPTARRRRMELERRWRERQARSRVLLDLLLPGLGSLQQGQAWSGGLRVLTALVASVLLAVSAGARTPLAGLLPPPLELGALAPPLCMGFAVLLLIPLYVQALHGLFRARARGPSA